MNMNRWPQPSLELTQGKCEHGGPSRGECKTHKDLKQWTEHFTQHLVAWEIKSTLCITKQKIMMDTMKSHDQAMQNRQHEFEKKSRMRTLEHDRITMGLCDSIAMSPHVHAQVIPVSSLQLPSQDELKAERLDLIVKVSGALDKLPRCQDGYYHLVALRISQALERQAQSYEELAQQQNDHEAEMALRQSDHETWSRHLCLKREDGEKRLSHTAAVGGGRPAWKTDIYQGCARDPKYHEGLRETRERHEETMRKLLIEHEKRLAQLRQDDDDCECGHCASMASGSN